MKRFTTLFFMTVLVCHAYAQDPQYSQFYANPLFLNPAFAGTASNTRIAVNHRLQFPSLPKAFRTYSLSVDYAAEHYNSGFGFLLNTVSEGTVDLQSSTGSFIYSYHLVLHKNLVFQPAIKIGHTSRSFDQTKLILSDQLNFGGGIVSQDPGLRSLRLQNFWDIGSGFLVYTNRYWFGLGVDHINRPNTSLLEGQDKLSIRYSAHFGGRFTLSALLPTGVIPASIAPSILYRRQGNFQQLDIGASIHLQPIVLGVYYRG